MKNQEMITVIPADISNLPKFKDERLQKATAEIAAIYTQAAKFADEKNREIAKVLSDVASDKSYIKDGFKSVAEYANKIFGINRQNAYVLASAGKVYKDENAHPELKAMSPSKLAELSNVSADKLKAALDSGEIKSGTTQKALRDFASKAREGEPEKDKEEEPKKAEVLVTYTAVPVGMFDGNPYFADDIMKSPKTLEEWDKYFLDVVEMCHNTMAEAIKLPNGKVSDDSKKATITRRLYINKGYSLVVEYFAYIPKNEPKKSTAPKFTREELMRMLASLDEEEKVEKPQDKTAKKDKSNG